MDTNNDVCQVGLTFTEAPADAVRALVTRYGRPHDFKSAWGEAPAMEELLALAAEVPQIAFHGAVEQGLDGQDWVSVQGFEATGLDSDQAFFLMTKYENASELVAGYDRNGARRVRTCWY